MFWLTRPLNPASFLRRRSTDVKVQKFASWRSGGRREAPNVTSYAPLTLLPYRNTSFLASEWVARNSLKVTVPQVRKVLKRSGFTSPDILWLSDVSQASVLDLVDAKKVVFHVTDDYSQFPNAPASTQSVVDSIVKRSDAVIATHPAQAERFRSYGVPAHYIPQGVVSENFLERLPIPKEYDDIPQPRAIYLGALAEWFDWPMLHSVIKLCGDISFVFIGRMTATSAESRKWLQTILAEPNVYWLGAVKEIVSNLQHADVGIIPFQRTELVYNINPMKLYEYLASGLPVVSTWPAWTIAKIQPGSSVYAAETAEEFADAVRKFAETDSPNRQASKDSALEFVNQNSWNARFNEALQLLGFDSA